MKLLKIAIYAYKMKIAQEYWPIIFLRFVQIDAKFCVKRWGESVFLL